MHNTAQHVQATRTEYTAARASLRTVNHIRKLSGYAVRTLCTDTGISGSIAFNGKTYRYSERDRAIAGNNRGVSFTLPLNIRLNGFKAKRAAEVEVTEEECE